VPYWGVARPISAIDLTSEEKAELHRRVRSATATQRDALRARIVLLRTEGKSEAEVAATTGVSVNTVSLWSRRFEHGGMKGLADAPGRGRRPSLPESKVRQVITKVTQPPAGHQRWSTRTMARAVGISHQSVHSIWKKNDLKPHQIRTFKISRDPRFEEKFWDVVGLYLDPPDKALVLCCDEKSQCQALERTQPGLPLGIGHIRTKTHDYKRHGTITLFAALNYLDGKLISRTERHHTHVEWLRFLRQIDRETPRDRTVHVIADNYATHKHKRVKEWLGKHPRFKMHFTPTSSSWMNLVERFFGELTSDCIRDGSFQNVRELVDAITDYLAAHNETPKRYVWKAKGQDILNKIQRAKTALPSFITS
jgi:transposase